MKTISKAALAAASFALCAALLPGCSVIGQLLGRGSGKSEAKPSAVTIETEQVTAEPETTQPEPLAENYVRTARSESWTYTDYNNEVHEFSCEQPEVLLDSADAKKANAKIEEICERVYDALEKNEDMSNVSNGCEYEAFINGKTLSLLFIDNAPFNNVVSYFVYNFDIDSGLLISDEELLERAGTTPEKAQSDVKYRILEFFDERYAQINTPEATSAMNDAKSFSVGEENLAQTHYYIGAGGKLTAVYRYRWIAGAEFYYNVTAVSAGDE